MKKYALVSVTDKGGLLPFVRQLMGIGFYIVASEGTHKYLKDHGIKSICTTSLTKFPPIMRPQGVKTLHPMIHGGIFADRENKDHLADAEKHGILLYDVVVCNFYSFEKTLDTAGSTHADAIQNIDIGGPTMVRAAAKNYKNVAIVTDKADYKGVLQELKKTGVVSPQTRLRLAIKAFEYTRLRDDNIIGYLKRAE